MGRLLSFLSFTIMVAGMIFMFSKPAAAIPGDVKNTKHNLGSLGPGNFRAAAGETTEVCKFCHTPHNAMAGRKFLWNNASYPTYDFKMYTATDLIPDSQKGNPLSEVSRMCMSCHDGAGALNAMAATGGNPIPVMEGSKDAIADVVWFEKGSNIGGGDDLGTRGTNLTNDHPVSIDYQAVWQHNSDQGTLSLKTKAYAESQGIVFWGGMLECVSCHDPHVNSNESLGGNPAFKPFLRRSNSSSNLCFACHDK